jgi:hypothetical protein
MKCEVMRRHMNVEIVGMRCFKERVEKVWKILKFGSLSFTSRL